MSLCQLPPEILHAIFYFVDVKDILRIRRVSRYLNDATYCREVWVNAYRKAKCIRPPGPFPSQSMGDLEKVLVTSFRIHQNLRGSDAAKTKRMLYSREIRYNGKDLGVSLVLGRFMLVSFSEEIRCYDLSLDKSSNGELIYQSTFGGGLGQFHCISTVDVEGRPFVCVMFRDGDRTESNGRTGIFSLNAGGQSRVTLDLLHQIENSDLYISGVSLGPRVIAVQQGDFDIGWKFIALDVHTRAQFLVSYFPDAMKAKISEEGMAADLIHHPRSISTSTHLVLACSFHSRATGWGTFFQAFTFPSSSSSDPTSTPLSPSHNGVIRDMSISRSGNLLLNDVIDSTTQDALITIAAYAWSPSFFPGHAITKCGILRLKSTGILASDGMGDVEFQPLGQFFDPRLYHYGHTFHGTGRAIRMLHKRSSCTIEALEYDVRARTNSGEPKVKITTLTFPHALHFPHPTPKVVHYDPYFGQISIRYYTRNMCVLRILDLAEKVEFF